MSAEYEQAQFHRNVNQAATVIGAVATGYIWYRAFQVLTARAWLYFLGSLGCLFWAVAITPDPFDGPPGTMDESGLSFFQISLLISAVGLFIAAFREVYLTQQQRNAAQYAAQQQYVAQQQAAYAAQQAAYAAQQAAQQPATQRVQRSVTVVRSPRQSNVQSTVSSYQPSDVQKAIAERSQRRPVRHSEDHGGFTINDRRGFDPDLGE